MSTHQPADNATTSAEVKLVPKSKLELAGEFGVHRNTIANWCAALGIYGQKLLTVKQLALFYNEYGVPGSYQLNIGLA